MLPTSTGQRFTISMLARACVPFDVKDHNDWDGDGVQNNDCNRSRCGWEGSSTPNQDFGACSNDTTAGALFCLD